LEDIFLDGLQTYLGEYGRLFFFQKKILLFEMISLCRIAEI